MSHSRYMVTTDAVHYVSTFAEAVRILSAYLNANDENAVGTARPASISRYRVVYGDEQLQVIPPKLMRSHERALIWWHKRRKQFCRGLRK